MNKGTYAFLGLSQKSRERIHSWLEDRGFENLVNPDEYHTTVVYSHKYIPGLATYNPPMPILAEVKGWHVFPSQSGSNCLVLDVDDDLIQRIHSAAAEMGATWDFPEFKPHITVSNNYPYAEIPEEYPNFKVTFVSFSVEELK